MTASEDPVVQFLRGATRPVSESGICQNKLGGTGRRAWTSKILVGDDVFLCAKETLNTLIQSGR